MGFKDLFRKKKQSKGGKQNKPSGSIGSIPNSNNAAYISSNGQQTVDANETQQLYSKKVPHTDNGIQMAESNTSSTTTNSTSKHSSSLKTTRNVRRSSITESKRLSSMPTTFLRQSNTITSHQRSNSNSRTFSLSKAISNPMDGVNSLPAELVPIVTLIHAQQARSYCEMFVQVPIEDLETSNIPNNTLEWIVVSAKLSGTELVIWEMDTSTASEIRNDYNGGFKPIYINISDAQFSYLLSVDPTTQQEAFELSIKLTDNRSYLIRFATKQDIDYFYSCLLLAQFEFKQLQESFTGALLSSKAIHFSDIRTLLAPNNNNIKEEWCVLRFPFLNDKWIRCYVVIVPHMSSKKKQGKIKIYTSESKSKKSLLASIVNAKSCVSIYPENPEFIDNNSLLRLSGECFINQALLAQVISGEIDTSGPASGVPRSRSSSFGLSKKKSSSSLISLKGKQQQPKENVKSPSHSRTNSLTKKQQQHHTRVNSLLSVDSSNSDIAKGKNGVNIVQSHLCYIIPETHSGVKPSETMIRLLIPIMNAFKLYGRPNKFISSRDNKESLLFGLPQLPYTQYLDNENSYQLVSLNIQNSVQENWSSFDWLQVFKEMVFFKMSKGWQGSGSLVDTFKDGLLYNKEKFEEFDNFDYDYDYDPAEDFIDFAVGASPSAHGSLTNGAVQEQARVKSPLSIPEVAPVPLPTPPNAPYANFDGVQTVTSDSDYDNALANTEPVDSSGLKYSSNDLSSSDFRDSTNKKNERFDYLGTSEQQNGNLISQTDFVINPFEQSKSSDESWDVNNSNTQVPELQTGAINAKRIALSDPAIRSPPPSPYSANNGTSNSSPYVDAPSGYSDDDEGDRVDKVMNQHLPLPTKQASEMTKQQLMNGGGSHSYRTFIGGDLKKNNRVSQESSASFYSVGEAAN